MDKEEVLKIVKDAGLTCSGQFLEFALKFNSKKLVIQFVEFWKKRPVGGGDIVDFFTHHYKDKLGE